MKLHPATTYVAEVMTPNPTMVNVDDSAMECLGIMIERRFRHLPVRTPSDTHRLPALSVWSGSELGTRGSEFMMIMGYSTGHSSLMDL